MELHRPQTMALSIRRMQRQIQLAGQSSLSLSLVLLESSQLTALSFFLKKEKKKANSNKTGLLIQSNPWAWELPVHAGGKSISLAITKECFSFVPQLIDAAQSAARTHPAEASLKWPAYYRPPRDLRRSPIINREKIPYVSNYWLSSFSRAPCAIYQNPGTKEKKNAVGRWNGKLR